MKKKISLSICIAFLLSFCSCNNNTAVSTETSDLSETAEAVIADASEMFTERDNKTDYDENGIVIELNGDNATASSDSVKIDGTVITITEDKTHIIKGTLNNGQIIVNAPETAKLQLVFDNVNITNETSAPFYIAESDKVFVTLKGENSLASTDFAESDDNTDGAVFSKQDLTFNGDGSLAVNSAKGHGIVCKDDLVLTGGTFDITAASHGIDANDSVRITNASITATTGKDGIHSENNDDTSLGYVYVSNAEMKLTSQGDGISAGAYIQIDSGSFDITTSGDKNSDTSTKGIKATSAVSIKDGTFKINSVDDSIHSNGSITIDGGSFEISSVDDGVHSDTVLTVNNCNMNITKSYEGLEAPEIYLKGGAIDIVASDDGINAGGGADNSGFGGRDGMFGGKNPWDSMSADENVKLDISGGKINVNAKGDGIDSNGNVTVSGGEIYVSGPTNGGNGALDYQGTATITGGTFLAAGSTGMAQNFSEASTQGAMLVNISGEKDSILKLTDESGNALIEWEADKQFECVVLSCPQVVQGKTYTIAAGNNSTSITMDGIIYGSTGGMQGVFDGKNNGNFGGRPDKGNFGEMPEMPEGGFGERPDNGSFGKFPDKEKPSGTGPDNVFSGGETADGENV